MLCAGHSLGAALAGLCGVWASNQYPSADVLTVVIGQVSRQLVKLRTRSTLVIARQSPLIGCAADIVALPLDTLRASFVDQISASECQQPWFYSPL